MVEKLHSNLIRRFADGYKQVSPYNSLTLLDPRYLVPLYSFLYSINIDARYADLYYDPADYDKAVEDLCVVCIDSVYDEDIVQGRGNGGDPGPVVQVVQPPDLTTQQNSFSRRR